MKTIISHLGSKMPAFYEFKLEEIHNIKKRYEGLLDSNNLQMHNSHLYPILHEVGQCYWHFFRDILDQKGGAQKENEGVYQRHIKHG